jgi:tetratricopeptide (TPR) repeat protein
MPDKNQDIFAKDDYVKLTLIWAVLMGLFLIVLIYAPSFLRTLRASDPTQYRVTGYQYLQEKKYDLSIENLKTAIELSPNDAQSYYFIAQAYEGKGVNPEAEKAYQKALNLNASNFDYQQQAGWFYERTNQWDQAAQFWEKMLKSYPKNEFFNLHMAIIAERKKEYATALKYYQIVTDLDPRSSLGYRGIAQIYTAQNLKDKALSAWEKVITLDPNDALAHFQSGIFYYQKSEVDRAIQSVQKALDLDSTNFYHYNELANFYYTRSKPGDIEQAEKLWAGATTVRPDFSDPYYRLGIIRAFNKKYAQAIPLYEKAIERNPNSKYYFLDLGVAYEQIGNKELAKKAYQKALVIDPNDPIRGKIKKM